MEKHLAQFNPFLKDTSFVNLMTRRIFNVLLVANPYDAFMLEDDGRIDEKLFEEYTRLGLRYPPRFTQVSTPEEATLALQQQRFDLVICMPGTDNSDAFDIGRGIKEHFPSTPIVVLTPFSHGITRYMERQDLSLFEYVFCWLGNTELLLSIIKLMEDKMNLEHDIREGGVQMILLVEDSIRFYSSVLPNLYKYVLEQSRALFAAALLSLYGRQPEDLDREIAGFLAKNLTKMQIMSTIEMLEKYHGECAYNVGTGHLLGALAAELEGIL